MPSENEEKQVLYKQSGGPDKDALVLYRERMKAMRAAGVLRPLPKPE